MPTRAAAEGQPRSAQALVDVFLAELQRRRYSTSLLDRAERVLPRFISHLRGAGVRDLRGVSEAHVVSYLRRLARGKTLSGRPASLTTQGLYLSVVRRFFRFLVRRRLMLQDPAAGVVTPRADTLPRIVLSISQARRLMTAPMPFHARWWWRHVEQRDRAILELLYGAGLRMGECVRLEAGDLDLLQTQVLVRNGKGRKDRVVPLPTRAVFALDAYLREARPAFLKDPRVSALFTSWQGRPLKPVTLVAMIRRRAQAAKLPVRISPHVLRHSCATHLLQGGADVRHVQAILGHACIESTIRYTRVVTADLARVLERAHPRERQWRRRANATKIGTVKRP